MRAILADADQALSLAEASWNQVRNRRKRSNSRATTMLRDRGHDPEFRNILWAGRLGSGASKGLALKEQTSDALGDQDGQPTTASSSGQ
ncbi:hypothetical protein I6F15_20170 [Bradyrhizobium sp. BRP14]|nr:hypothetical protein [Bradyrhizobium sp. BRP14]